jgi:serine/threonine protein kinase
VKDTPQESIMAADQPRSLEHVEAHPPRLESLPRDSGLSQGQDRVAAQLDVPASRDRDPPKALVEKVKLDLSRAWLQGQPVNLESYLESFPELGTPETVPAELILAEYEVRCQFGEAVELAQFEQRFPHQSGELLRLINQRPRGSATGSTLGRISEMVAKPQASPLSLARDAKAAPALPRRFGRYRVLRELGQGAMGTVYLVLDTQLCRQVAMKVPHVRRDSTSGSPNRRVLDRFYREAHAAAVLHHPNLCPVYDVGEINGVPYLTMAYIRGRPLSRYIDPNHPLSPRWVAILVRKLALALQTAHDKGIVHRDLKPSNVIIGVGREPIIMDFGLAWRLDSSEGDERLTRPGLILGTPAYMSPEQLTGRVENLGPRCDVYSLGVVLYELLTGRCPFEGPEAIVLGQVLFIEPKPPSSHRPDLDPLLEAICLKAMAKSDVERYASMSEFAAALSSFLRRRTIPTQPRSSADEPFLSESSQSQLMEVIAPNEPDTSDAAIERGEPQADQVEELSVAVLSPEGMIESWSRWTTTVGLFARGRGSRKPADAEDFKVLRDQLLATVRERAAEAQGPDAEFYLRLEELILPWVELRSLAREERDMLEQLHALCVRVEQILNPQLAEVPPEPSVWDALVKAWEAVDAHSAELASKKWLPSATITLGLIFAILFWLLFYK